MKITILTTVTKPKERQDIFQEAFENYKSFADEVVVIDGSGNNYVKQGDVHDLGKMKVVWLDWPDEWNWVEFPRHLNEGLKHCTGDWIIRLDIDQVIHERDFGEIRKRFYEAKPEEDVMTFQKLSPTYSGKYYSKAETKIAFRNKPYIAFGKNNNEETDYCFPIYKEGEEQVVLENGEIYKLPVGKDLIVGRTGVPYWNYDYFFKTQDVVRKYFFRMSKAYHRAFNSWHFGDTEDNAFQIFLNMQRARHDKATLVYKLEDHPIATRELVKNIKTEQFGHSGWKNL